MIFSDREKEPGKPIPPVLSDYPRGSRFDDDDPVTFAMLTVQGKADYQFAYKLYESERKEYQHISSLLTKARAIILGSISEDKAASLNQQDRTRDWFKILEASSAPSEGYIARIIGADYAALMANVRSFEHEPRDWVNRWERTMTDAKRYGLPQLYSGVWLRDIADVVKQLSDGLATAIREEALV